MHILIKSLLTILMLLMSHMVQAQHIVACEPEWAALSRTLMPSADVKVATHARQDPHHIEARPALISLMRQADLAVCTGAALEIGWLPLLQQRSGNPKIQDGAIGMFYAAEHVKLIDPFVGIITPFDGDVHPQGNPHFHTDPYRLLLVAKALSERMKRIWPNQSTQITQRYIDFENKWNVKIKQWEKQAAPLRGKHVAVQHVTFAYMLNWLGLRQTSDLEPKPGMSPSPSHLQQVLKVLKKDLPVAIVLAGYQNQKPSQWLVDQLENKVPMLSLPSTVENDAKAEELINWFDGIIQSFTTAAKI